MTTSHTASDGPAISQPKMFKHGVILCLFCLGFGLVLAITNEITLDDISARAIEDKQNSLSQVLPDELHDNNPVTGSGYAGEMKLMMGLAADGKLLGVRVLAHKETPGLGDKIEVKKGPWIERFTGLSVGNPPIERWKVKKDGGDFDQFAGATITPRAVLKAIRSGLEFFAENKTALTKGD